MGGDWQHRWPALIGARLACFQSCFRLISRRVYAQDVHAYTLIATSVETLQYEFDFCGQYRGCTVALRVVQSTTSAQGISGWLTMRSCLYCRLL